MIRRLKPSDTGFLVLFSSRVPDVVTLDAAPPEQDSAELNPELGAWGEGSEVVHIDSRGGFLDPSGLGFVVGWSEKKESQ